MDTVAPPRCRCEVNFITAIAEVDGKAQRLPEHREVYMQTKLELQRIRAKHFRTCVACQQEEVGSRQEAA